MAPPLRGTRHIIRHRKIHESRSPSLHSQPARDHREPSDRPPSPSRQVAGAHADHTGPCPKPNRRTHHSGATTSGPDREGIRAPSPSRANLTQHRIGGAYGESAARTPQCATGSGGRGTTGREDGQGDAASAYGGESGTRGCRGVGGRCDWTPPARAAPRCASRAAAPPAPNSGTPPRPPAGPPPSPTSTPPSPGAFCACKLAGRHTHLPDTDRHRAEPWRCERFFMGWRSH